MPASAQHWVSTIKEGSAMAKLRVLSSRGDTVVEWDERKVERRDPEALAAVREAERIFEEQRARGATAFVVTPEKPARRIDQFDPMAEQIIMVPRVAGG
jgi:hypothetical protein